MKSGLLYNHRLRNIALHGIYSDDSDLEYLKNTHKVRLKWHNFLANSNQYKTILGSKKKRTEKQEGNRNS